MSKRLVIANLMLLAILAVGIVWLVPRNMYLITFVEQLAPGVIPASSYARNLNSSDPDVVRESLAHLTDRKDPIAAARAVELLKSPDDYIWLNAAHYAGVCGRQEAVPCLIKSLRHTAWRADNKAAQYLYSLTGQDNPTSSAAGSRR